MGSETEWMAQKQDAQQNDCDSRKGAWSSEEDAQLSALVEQHGTQSWSIIAVHIKGRSGKSCRLRWHNQLNPAVNKQPWSEWEQAVIVRAQSVHQNRWAAIARLLHGRTDNAVKNHWHATLNRKHQNNSLKNKYLDEGVSLEWLLEHPEQGQPEDAACRAILGKAGAAAARSGSGALVKGRVTKKRASRPQPRWSDSSTDSEAAERSYTAPSSGAGTAAAAAAAAGDEGETAGQLQLDAAAAAAQPGFFPSSRTTAAAAAAADGGGVYSSALLGGAAAAAATACSPNKPALQQQYARDSSGVDQQLPRSSSYRRLRVDVSGPNWQEPLGSAAAAAADGDVCCWPGMAGGFPAAGAALGSSSQACGRAGQADAKEHYVPASTHNSSEVSSCGGSPALPLGGSSAPATTSATPQPSTGIGTAAAAAAGGGGGPIWTSYAPAAAKGSHFTAADAAGGCLDTRQHRREGPGVFDGPTRSCFSIGTAMQMDSTAAAVGYAGSTDMAASAGYPSRYQQQQQLGPYTGSSGAGPGSSGAGPASHAAAPGGPRGSSCYEPSCGPAGNWLGSYDRAAAAAAATAAVAAAAGASNMGGTLPYPTAAGGSSGCAPNQPRPGLLVPGAYYHNSGSRDMRGSSTGAPQLAPGPQDMDCAAPSAPPMLPAADAAGPPQHSDAYCSPPATCWSADEQLEASRQQQQQQQQQEEAAVTQQQAMLMQNSGSIGTLGSSKSSDTQQMLPHQLQQQPSVSATQGSSLTAAAGAAAASSLLPSFGSSLSVNLVAAGDVQAVAAVSAAATPTAAGSPQTAAGVGATEQQQPPVKQQVHAAVGISAGDAAAIDAAVKPSTAAAAAAGEANPAALESAVLAVCSKAGPGPAGAECQQDQERKEGAGNVVAADDQPKQEQQQAAEIAAVAAAALMPDTPGAQFQQQQQQDMLVASPRVHCATDSAAAGAGAAVSASDATGEQRRSSSMPAALPGHDGPDDCHQPGVLLVRGMQRGYSSSTDLSPCSAGPWGPSGQPGLGGASQLSGPPSAGLPGYQRQLSGPPSGQQQQVPSLQPYSQQLPDRPMLQIDNNGYYGPSPGSNESAAFAAARPGMPVPPPAMQYRGPGSGMPPGGMYGPPPPGYCDCWECRQAAMAAAAGAAGGPPPQFRPPGGPLPRPYSSYGGSYPGSYGPMGVPTPELPASYRAASFTGPVRGRGPFEPRAVQQSYRPHPYEVPGSFSNGSSSSRYSSQAYMPAGGPGMGQDAFGAVPPSYMPSGPGSGPSGQGLYHQGPSSTGAAATAAGPAVGGLPPARSSFGPASRVASAPNLIAGQQQGGHPGPSVGAWGGSSEWLPSAGSGSYPTQGRQQQQQPQAQYPSGGPGLYCGPEEDVYGMAAGPPGGCGPGAGVLQHAHSSGNLSSTPHPAAGTYQQLPPAALGRRSLSVGAFGGSDSTSWLQQSHPLPYNRSAMEPGAAAMHAYPPQQQQQFLFRGSNWQQGDQQQSAPLPGLPVPGGDCGAGQALPPGMMANRAAGGPSGLRAGSSQVHPPSMCILDSTVLTPGKGSTMGRPAAASAAMADDMLSGLGVGLGGGGPGDGGAGGGLDLDALELGGDALLGVLDDMLMAPADVEQDMMMMMAN